LRDPQRAIQLATEALKAVQDNTGNGAESKESCWSALARAQFRAEQYEAALSSFEKANVMKLNSADDSFDAFFLAIAHHKLGHKQEARRWYERGLAWKIVLKGNVEVFLDRLQPEAAEVLGILKR
jgi:Flp pilus assembly protein TadD